MPDRIAIDVGPRETTTALVYGATGGTRAGATLVLAHGAGAGQSSPFMVRYGAALASRGLDVVTFNFLYSEQRRRAPDRTEKLESCYRAVIATARTHGPLDGNALFIGGKSMGGRIASHLAASADVADHDIAGLVFLGYPLHPPGKPDQLRAVHLSRIRAPMLFIQGSRDPFGTPGELRPILEPLGARVTLHVVENGGHSLEPSKASPAVAERTHHDVQEAIVQWIASVRD